jgi:hypothetical protein
MAVALQNCTDQTVAPTRVERFYAIMKLIDAVTQGSGVHNEDGFGVCVRDGRVTAAWVLDGVTGINEKPVVDVPNEPQWFVERAQTHLKALAADQGDVQQLLHGLCQRLAEDWQQATKGMAIPARYDLPAACLTFVKNVDGRWQGLRLGDSYILSREKVLINHPFPPSDLPDLEADLKQAAAARRAQGLIDMQQLRDEFRPRLMSNRSNRNAAGGYSILVPDATPMVMPQLFELGTPTEILLCTDGYYRAVDIYALHDDNSLFAASMVKGGVHAVLSSIRGVEAEDAACTRFARFKPADDVTALALAMT